MRLRLALESGLLSSDVRTDRAAVVARKLLLVVVLHVHFLLLPVLVVEGGRRLVHRGDALTLRRGRAERLLAQRLVVETLLGHDLLHALVLVARLHHLHVVVTGRRRVDVQRAELVWADADDGRLVLAVRRLHKVLLLLRHLLMRHVETLLERLTLKLVGCE